MEDENLIIELSKRLDIIKCIANGGASKRVITTETPVSKSTISRVIRNLQSKNIIYREDNDYVLTNFGELAYKKLNDILEYYNTINEAKSLFDYLPEYVSIEQDVFDGATVTCADLPEPAAPRTGLANIIANNSGINCIITTISKMHVKLYKNNIGNFNNVILDDRAADYIDEFQISELDRSSNRYDSNMYCCGKILGYTLVCNHEFIWIGVHDEHGQLKGSIHNDSLKAVEWANQKLQTYLYSDTTTKIA